MKQPILKTTKFDNEDVIATSISLLKVANGEDNDAIFSAIGLNTSSWTGSVTSTSGALSSTLSNNALNPAATNITNILLYSSQNAQAGVVLNNILSSDNSDNGSSYSDYNGYYTYNGTSSIDGIEYYVFRKNQ